MQIVAQNWLVYSLTKSPFYLGLDAFLQQLPIILFSLIGGVFADRYDRRRTLLLSQIVQMSDVGGARAPDVSSRSSRSGTSSRCRSSPAARRHSAGRRISR